jgi:mannosyl-glycoprotein endo-beta-N-acetylglucosaminidase
MKYLTDRMHKVMPGSLIIWYDSVTYIGELKWQNKLNAENR